MSFEDNLKSIRKKRHISQEELAEKVGVSRQAVSKWEQGGGYPEVEKLIILSRVLNVSLDYLILGEIETTENTEVMNPIIVPTGKITIQSYDRKTITNCSKVLASRVMYKPRMDEPKYWLIGVSQESFWGEKSILLGWYADEKEIKKEMNEIACAIQNGKPLYELRYAAKVKTKFLRIKLDEKTSL